MRALRKIAAAILGTVIIFLPAIAEAKKIKLKLTYDNKVKLRLISLNFNSELDFILDGNNISVYNPQNGGKFIGDRSTGHGYYYGPVDLRFRAGKGAIDMYGIYKTHVLHTHIRTDGVSSCAATIDTHLKPGYSVYEYDEPGYGSVNVYATDLSNIQCELSTI